MRKDTIIKRIVWITADLFRFTPGPLGPEWVPTRNVEVLRTLLNAAIGWREGIEVRVLDHDALGFTPEEFAGKTGVGADPEAWRRASFEPLQDWLRALIAERLRGNCVVAFEASDSLWAVFTAEAERCLDLSLHPCRYLPDLAFVARAHGFALNDPNRAPAFEAALNWEASLLSGRLRLGGLPPSDAQDGLLAMQVPTDRALMDRNGFARITQHLPEVQAAAGSHDRLLVRPHPTAPIEVEEAEALLRFPNVVFTGTSSYRLLAAGGVQTVYALSSSLIHEARYFGAKGVAFRPDLSLGLPLRNGYHPVTVETLIDIVVEELAQLPRSDGLPARIASSGPLLRELIGEYWSQTNLHHGEGTTFPPFSRLGVAEGELRQALTIGWAEPEAWGVWGVGPLNVLTFAWPSELDDSLELVIEAVASTGLLSNIVPVEVWSGGVRLATVGLSNQGMAPMRFAVEVPRPASGDTVQIAFLNRAPRSPAEHGGGSDTRPLGMGLISVQALR